MNVDSDAGFRPPQQARSRKALQRIMAAAEEVLAADGFDEFTMAAVAARAGVSVGSIYRRFEGREQLLGAVKDRLLTRYEEDLAEKLRSREPNLSGVIRAYVRAVTELLADGSAFVPELLMAGNGAELEDRGLRALQSSQKLFEDAAAPFVGEIRRPEPESALRMVTRTVTGASIHRAISVARMSDDLTWDVYAQDLADMAVAYLTAPRI